jgi:hypothetical protein
VGFVNSTESKIYFLPLHSWTSGRSGGVGGDFHHLAAVTFGLVVVGRFPEADSGEGGGDESHLAIRALLAGEQVADTGESSAGHSTELFDSSRE